MTNHDDTPRRKIPTSALLLEGQQAVLQRLAANRGYYQSRGSGSGRDGSVSLLLQAIASGAEILVDRDLLRHLRSCINTDTPAGQTVLEEINRLLEEGK